MLLAGLMSGTSLDGIDAALLEIEDGGPGGTEFAAGGTAAGQRASGENADRAAPGLRWRILAFRSRPYSDAQREVIREAVEGRARVPELARLHVYLGEWFAGALLSLLEEAGVRPEEVAAIGSHGQTVRHDPPRGSERGHSFQLGDPATLAERTGTPVVSDFRARDLAAGGHGAPLVPRADLLLFHEPGRARALQNLGGMGNVTWLPPSGDPAQVRGFDTGPGVALLDEAAARATGGKWDRDLDGALARQGRVDEALLKELLTDPYFEEEPPRSTGRERFGPPLIDRLARELPPGRPEEWVDLLATLTALTARSVADSYRRWILPLGLDEVVLLGGGSRNPALVDAIRHELTGELGRIPLRGGDALGIDPDAREAAAFAVLAWCHLRGLPGNVPAVTGAEGERVLGSWTPGRDVGGTG